MSTMSPVQQAPAPQRTAGAPHERGRRRAGRGAGILTHLILIGFCLFSLVPFVNVLLISVAPQGQLAVGIRWPSDIDFGNFPRAWDAANFSVLMLNSAIVTLFVVTIGTLVSLLAGYALGTMRFPGRGMVFVLFLIGLLMPFEATIVPLYYDLREVGLANTYAGLILPEAALFLSFGAFWMRAHFLATERALLEAARIDGANTWTILWRVLVPNARGPITTMMVLFFIWSWNEFLLALVLAQDPAVQTVPAGLGLFIGQYTTDYSGLSAAAIIMTVPALLVFVVLQRHFIRGVTSGGVKG
ncbi:carbohydrate ABC transporter permease [Streptomyces shenzhenensis]|nr:carbohydrate ABC transporter permease [Streptomyces shenzhenensis]